MGRSNLQRYYAIVEIGNQNLAELLVSRGYARVKGTVANLPSGMKSKEFTEKLKKLEVQAKEKHLGAWAKSAKTHGAK
jgi:endonuclease YncB( thermonuclease family)